MKVTITIEVNKEEVVEEDKVVLVNKYRVPTTTMKKEKTQQEDEEENTQIRGTINLNLSATIVVSLSIMLKNVDHLRIKFMIWKKD